MQTVWAVVFLAGLSIFISIFFKDSFTAFSENILEKMGQSGLILAVMLSDLVASPLPTDGVLLLIAKSQNPSGEWLFVLFLGTVSSLTGTLAWFLAKHVLKPRWFGAKFAAFVNHRNDFINRYGKWAVALGALTPIPYSITCWGAGLCKMRFFDFFLMSLLRIPRFAVFYAILLL